MPTNLLLLPLLGGYWFLHVFYYTRFRSQRLDGYRLLVESALIGVLLVFLSRIFVVSLNHCCLIVRSIWFTVSPRNIAFLGTATVSLLLGLMIAYPLNFILDATGLLTLVDAQTKAIERHGNDLLRLLHAASSEEKTVSISLDNGKFYIGLIAAAPNLAPHDTYLAITPFYSGYRNRETLTLVFTVNYLDVYERHGLDPENFRVVLPMANVRIASLFDQSAYPAFVVESDQSQPDARA
jgi:hypothetical protein